MEFPLVNISINNWQSQDFELYYLFDNLIYKPNDEFYEKYYFNNLYVDCEGDIYKLVDRKMPSKLLQFFSFIPNLCKVELIFKPTGNKMTIEEAREYMLKFISYLDNSEPKREWIDKVSTASTIEDIIG